MTTLQIELPKEIRRGMLYFLVKAETATCLHQAAFFTEDRPDNRVSFSLVICSYRRKGWLEENLKKITMDPALQKLARENGFVVRIVDNAGELADSYGPGNQGVSERKHRRFPAAFPEGWKNRQRRKTGMEPPT